MIPVRAEVVRSIKSAVELINVHPQMAIFSLSRRIYHPACKPYGLEAGPEAAISAPAPQIR